MRETAPASIAEWISGAPLMALRKSNNDVRPIALGKTLRSMVSSIVIARQREDAKDFLVSHQLGLPKRFGSETIIHTTREFTQRFGYRPELALLQLDLSNAFNLITRCAILKMVRKHFPAMLPWVKYCYGESTKPHLWLNQRKHTLRSRDAYERIHTSTNPIRTKFGRF